MSSTDTFSSTMSSTETLSNTTMSTTEESLQTGLSIPLDGSTLSTSPEKTSNFDSKTEDSTISSNEVSSIEHKELHLIEHGEYHPGPEKSLTTNTEVSSVEKKLTTPSCNLHKSDGEPCRRGTARQNLEKSNLWPHLMVLQNNINGTSNDYQESNYDIVHILSEKYDMDPLDFTQHLLTIIEETSMLFSMSGTSDASSGLLSTLGQTNSTLYKSLPISGLRRVRREFDTSDNLTSDGTPESVPSLPKIHNVTYQKTPKILGILRSSNKQGIAEKSPITIAGKDIQYTKTPKIVVIPETPRKDRFLDECSTNLNDNDDYVTAESEIEDSEDTTLEGIDRTKEKEVNLSQVLSRHREWVETFEKRKGKVSTHTNKLEQRWLRQLLQKRENCFATIKRLIENSAAEKSQMNEKNQCRCENCIQETNFYKTMMSCCDYLNYTNAALDFSNSSEKRRQKNRRSGILSPKNSKNGASNSQVIQGSTKKGSRKSIGQKSPSGKSKTPRRSVVVKPNIRPLISTRRARVKPEIDRSSIRPVAQLRKIFSPGTKTPESGITKIPLPQKYVPETFVTKCMIMPMVYRTSPTNKFGIVKPSASKQFGHVKSPVGEYIRGNLTIKKKKASSTKVE